MGRGPRAHDARGHGDPRAGHRRVQPRDRPRCAGDPHPDHLRPEDELEEEVGVLCYLLDGRVGRHGQCAGARVQSIFDWAAEGRWDVVAGCGESDDDRGAVLVDYRVVRAVRGGVLEEGVEEKLGVWEREGQVWAEEVGSVGAADAGGVACFAGGEDRVGVGGGGRGIWRRGEEVVECGGTESSQYTRTVRQGEVSADYLPILR